MPNSNNPLRVTLSTGHPYYSHDQSITTFSDHECASFISILFRVLAKWSLPLFMSEISMQPAIYVLYVFSQPSAIPSPPQTLNYAMQTDPVL